MLALYKQKGVNPASGCIPMLLTFPILLAFYNLLSSAIELRGAPFIGWIHDLSVEGPDVRLADPDGRDDVLAAEDDADAPRTRCSRRSSC